MLVDIFQLEAHSYLVWANRLTWWLEVAHLPSGTCSGKIMAQVGPPLAYIDG